MPNVHIPPMDTKRIGTAEVVTAAVLATVTATFVPELMRDERIKMVAATVIGTSIGSAIGKHMAYKILDFKKANKSRRN